MIAIWAEHLAFKGLLGCLFKCDLSNSMVLLWQRASSCEKTECGSAVLSIRRWIVSNVGSVWLDSVASACKKEGSKSSENAESIIAWKSLSLGKKKKK